MERCFSCAEIGNCTELYVRKPPDYYGPYFPTFERYNPPSSSNAISPDGTVKVCALCKIFLNSQWHNFELYKMPESQRIYFTKRHDGNELFPSHSESSMNSKSNFSWIKSETQKPININTESVNLSNKTSLTNTSSKNNLMEISNEKSDLTEELSLDISFPGNNKQLTEHYICCFVCGLPCLKWHAKTAYSSQMLENKEYFPFFEKLDPPQSSIPLTNGATKICIQCEADLSKQWDHYEKLGTDQMQRIYHITNDHSTQFSITNPGRFITNSVTNSQLFSMLKLKNTIIKCSLCLNKIIDSYKVSWNQRATCLCIPHLKNFQFPTEGVMVDKALEETIICDVCHYFLSCQTQNFVVTPFHLREYKLPKVGYLPPLYPGSNENKQSSNSSRKQSLGSSLSAFLPAESYQQTNSQNKRSKTPNLKSHSKTPVQQTNEQSRSNSISKSSINSQDQAVLGPIIANCHICLHELRDPNTLKTLRATANEDFIDQPYFPFLKSLRTNSMKNYEFPVCLHCYYNMCGQWRMSQKASIPIYERKYNHNEFMCTQCQRLYAQKSDTLILRDRLVCIACSENRNSDAVKSGFNFTNQDSTDASAQNLFAMKTKTTVTVTPISNELSIPSLASINYAETMKQYSKPSISTASTPSGINNSLGQFVDSFSRNSSDFYYNSKNMFGKSVKRPAVAAVAPNQRQNTPLIQNDTSSSQSDFSHMKMSDLSNFPGNYYSHNSAFNPFPSNINTSSNNSFALPMFSSNNPFGIPSHSPMTRKHSSSNSERDYLMKHSANFSSPYIDPKARINSLQNSVNPFINWQQPQSTQPPVHDSNPAFPFQPILGMDSYNNSNKEMEVAMKIWMSQQSSDNSLKFPNLWPNNSVLFDEMASSYFQAMLAQSLASGSRDDLIAPNIGPGSSGSNNNNNLQSLMANAAMANYQMQMLQMFAAYQSSMTGPPQQYPHGLNKSPAIPSLLNQINVNDPLAKLYRPDTGLLDPLFSNKMAPNTNGFYHLLKNSDTLKYPFGFDYEKVIKPQMNLNHTLLSGYSHPDLRSPYQKQSSNYVNSDRVKSNKSQRDDSNRNSDYKTPTSSPKPSCKLVYNNDSKYKKNNKPFCQSDVLDLSQSKTSRKSSYAIDSLTEYAKKADKDVSKVNTSQVDFVLSVKSTPEQAYSPPNLYDSPLNMSNPWIHDSTEIKSNNQSITHIELESENEQNRFIKILMKLNAHSLIDVLKSSSSNAVNPQIASSKMPSLSLSSSSSKTSNSCVMNFNKCPTIWQFHKFFKIVNALLIDLKQKSSPSTRSKSLFMKQLGLQDSFISKEKKTVNGMKRSMINHINSSTTSKKSKYEVYWTKWILQNLKRRLSLKNKPHLRRSLMRPVLSGDTEVRFCAAKNKHELENLRSIIKILIKYT